MAWLRRADILAGPTLLTAVVCGLITWLLIAAFHLRGTTVSLEVADGPMFLTRLRCELAEMGFRSARIGNWTYYFTPDFKALNFSGGVRAHASAGVAYVTGPKSLLERIRGRLRLHALAARARKESDADRRRRGRHLLRRVHISFRLPQQQGTAVPAEIVRVLADEGAEVTYEVNILAQSFGGIRDCVVEGLVRDRLLQFRITPDVRKEPLSSRVLEAAEAAR